MCVHNEHSKKAKFPIKCHQNDIAEYIENNLLFQYDSNQKELRKEFVSNNNNSHL